MLRIKGTLIPQIEMKAVSMLVEDLTQHDIADLPVTCWKNASKCPTLGHKNVLLSVTF